jgi:hypothetical protein
MVRTSACRTDLNDGYRTPRDAPPARTSVATVDMSRPIRTMTRLRTRIPPFIAFSAAVACLSAHRAPLRAFD